MVSRDDVLLALRDVEDPEIHKSIVELEMVKDIRIEDSTVHVEVLLTITNCPLQKTIEQQVTQKLMQLPGVSKVDLVISSMNDEERARFAAKLKGKSASEQTQSPLLDPTAGTSFIAVASGKGGVGKSTVTANLAIALAERGLRVGLIDADIYGFSIPAIFGVKEIKPTVIDDLIIPLEVKGVKLISMHFFVPENNPVVWRGPMLGKMLRNFFGEVHWGELDVLLLDLPPGTGDISMDVHQLLPKSQQLIVTTPQQNASDVAVRAGVMALRTNHEVIGVVENMAYAVCGHCGDRTYLFGQGGGEQVAHALRTRLLAQIPIGSGLDGTMLFHRDSIQGEAFAQLADEVVQKTGLHERTLTGSK